MNHKGAHGPINRPPGHTGEKYICFTRGQYRILVPLHGQKRRNGNTIQKHIGYFKTLEDALVARDKHLSSR